MATITFIEADGKHIEVEAQAGHSVMEVATVNMVRGIVGECGGGCSCATCHVYVDAEWFGKLTPADEMETGMLEGAVAPGPLSRLSCQIKVSDEINGLIVTVPSG